MDEGRRPSGRRQRAPGTPSTADRSRFANGPGAVLEAAAMTRILADVLIPGRGAPVRDGCVFLDDADVIAVAASPLDDIGVLGHAELITRVWKRGRLVVSRTVGGEVSPSAERGSSLRQTS